MEPIGIVTAILMIVALTFGQDFAMSAFILCSLLGAAAAINASGIGSIQPAHLLLAAVCATVLVRPGGVRNILADLSYPNPGFWLLCTWIYGVFCAIFIPGMSTGSILVNPIGIGQYGVSYIPVPLSPTTGNVTQSIYFTGDLACFLCCAVVAKTPRGLRILTLSLLAYCVGDVVMALADIATYNTGTVYLLDVIRNANYTIFVDTEGTSTKRIIGSFTEASAFASATLGVFGFSAQLWLQGVRPRLTSALTFSALVLLLLSTSSTAYVSLPFCLAILYARSCRCLMQGTASGTMLWFLVVFPLLVAAAILAVMLHGPTYTALRDFLDTMIFDKSTSQSGMERGRTNVEAWGSFLDSLGFGLGIGSVRASSFVLAVAANLGVIGGAFYAAFIGTALWRPDAEETAVGTAARMACLCLMISACVSGALIDLGLPFFMFAALSASRPSQGVQQRGRSRTMNRVVQAGPIGRYSWSGHR